MFDKLPVTWERQNHVDETPQAAVRTLDEPDPAPVPVPIPPPASHAKSAASEAITINILGPVHILCQGADITADVTCCTPCTSSKHTTNSHRAHQAMEQTAPLRAVPASSTEHRAPTHSASPATTSTDTPDSAASSPQP